MVEALAILGAISASLGLLNLARQGINSLAEDVRRYRKYGDTLFKLIHDIGVIQLQMKLWESEWGIEDSEQVERGIMWFGAAGWEKVQEEMGLIASASWALVGLLAPLMIGLSSQDRESVTPQPAEPSSRRKKLQKRGPRPQDSKLGKEFMQSLHGQTIQAYWEQKQSIKSLVESSNFAKRLSFVFSTKYKDLSENVEELRMRFGQLESVSARNFEAIFTHLSANMPIDVRKEAVQKRADINYAFYFRKNAIGLEFAFPPILTEPQDIGLELGVIRTVNSSPQLVEYTLLTEPGPYELSIKATGSHFPEAIDPFSTFVEAYQQALRGQSVWLRVVDTNNTTLHYSISALHVSGGIQRLRLAERLRRPSREHYISYRETLELSCRLAYSCLLILNTSWMSAFSSESSITRLRGLGESRYSLGFREIDRQRCQLLGQLSESTQPQAYSIGILLVELGLRKKVTDFQEQPPVLQMSDGEEIDLEHAILMTENELGPSFANVVWRCFYTTKLPRGAFDEEQREALELTMLHEFHENVFLP